MRVWIGTEEAWGPGSGNPAWQVCDLVVIVDSSYLDGKPRFYSRSPLRPGPLPTDTEGALVTWDEVRQ